MPLLFAYGALLDPTVLARRGLPPLPRPLPAVTPGLALAFAHRGGYATLVPAATAARWRGVNTVSSCPAHGALLTLPSRGALAALAVREGGYRVAEVDVAPYDGSGGDTRRALVFLSSPGMTLMGGPLPPRAAYASKLRAGAAAVGLEDGWLAWLNSVETIADGGSLPPAYNDTVAGRAAGVGAGVALVVAGVVAAGGAG